MNKNCPKCHVELPDIAKFCFNCGENVELAGLQVCSGCRSSNPVGSPRCYGCGRELSRAKSLSLDINLRYPLRLDAQDAVGEDFKAHFFKLLRHIVATELKPKLYGEYVEAFYRSGFERMYRRREAVWEDDVCGWYNREGDASLRKIDERTASELAYLVDYFVVTHGGKLNEAAYPAALLQYHDARLGDADFAQMALDYLAFEEERLVVFTNLVGMSPEKLSNAKQHFLWLSDKEQLSFVADLSPFGSSFKDGFAMTNHSIFWKCFDKPQQLFFHQLADIHREKSHLIINGKFFNAGLSINLKLLKLLKKIKHMFQE